MMAGNLWFFQALGASVLWGLGYALSDRLLRAGGLPTAFLMMLTGLVTLPLYFALSGVLGQIGPGIQVLRTGGPVMIGLATLVAVAIVGGNFLVCLSIAGKNATLASLVEISYPLFTCAFAWLVFRDTQLNVSTALGAVLIFAGIAVIYFRG